jgi:uncharacterized protein YeaO (DUF488 family)
MPVRTKRWNDAVDPGDGFRLLVCRLRPRGVPTRSQPWDDWWPDLGPSRRLLDEFHGKSIRDGAGDAGDAAAADVPLPWAEYVPRYLEEMRGDTQRWRLRALAERVAAGETVTLLCSSACTDPDRCHRTLLARLIGKKAPPG